MIDNNGGFLLVARGALLPIIGQYIRNDFISERYVFGI
jgi:hypothetical protein